MPSSSPSSRGLTRLIAFIWVLLVGAILVPVALLGTIAWRSYGATLADAQLLVQRTVDVLHEHVLKVLETEELSLDRISAEIAGRSWEEIGRSADTTDFLRRLAAGKEQIKAFWLLDRTGLVRAGSHEFPRGLSSADRDFFQAQVDKDAGTYIGKALIGRVTGKASFGLSRRRSAADGSFDGVIAISVSADYLKEFAADLTPEIDHSGSIVRADGEILMRERPGPMQLPASDPLMAAIKERSNGMLWRRSMVDGTKRLEAYRKVAGYPVYVSYGIGKAAVLEPWRDTLFLAGSLIGGGGIAFFLVTLLALRRALRERAMLVRLEHEMTQRAFAETALRQAQKVEALGQLASGIAHDFNNLLTVITGNLEMLRDRVAGTAVAEERFGMAMSAAERSEKLISSLLAFARQEPLEIKVFDVNKCLIELQPLLRHSLPSSIDLSLETAALPVLVETDIGQTETAVLNLVVNARDAMPRGGVICVAVSSMSLAGEPDGLRGEFAAVSIADSGEGMPPQTLEQVFEPFFTTKPPGKGTGLGLSMVHDFAKKSGGGIAIRSAVGAGTEVVLYLPRVAH